MLDHTAPSLRNANGFLDDQQEIPDAPAWRIGTKLVAVRCPLCGGVHKHSDPGEHGETIRLKHCAPVFIERAGDAYRMVVKDDSTMPEFLRRAMDDDLPFDALAVAVRGLLEGRSISFKRYLENPVDEKGDEQFWTPTAAQVTFALKVLEQCGAFGAARALRTDLPSRFARRHAAALFWRTREGGTMRRRLITALAETYRGVGQW